MRIIKICFILLFSGLLLATTIGLAWANGPTPVMVKDINPAGSSGPYYLTVVNGTLFFFANDGPHGNELWKSDGTLTGTVMISDINPAGNSDPGWIADVNGTLFFGADDGTHGYELWKLSISELPPSPPTIPVYLPIILK